MRGERVENIEEAKKEVVTLRSQIQRLGSVNMSAPEEYEELSERYEFLNKQLKDLEQSKENLLELIDEMDEIMKVQFKEMFEKINHEFDTTFKELFGGGHGKLVLEDENDLLNTGVDIDVQPPGKTIQNIRLFSGGEKSLIAISVLFAILRARRVPLCIFDEVEAALDQGNVERFARYISKFSDTTQFIVITHRPGTMAQCDTLYGVTMAQKGISSLLKVRLSQAVEISESERS
jgi:chromosome segregation protein